MNRSEIRKKLDRLQREGRIDRWTEVRSHYGFMRFWVQADNSNEWVLWHDEGDEV